jgi:hypothetical protein
MSDVQTVCSQRYRVVWSFYRFLHVITTKGGLNFPPERSEVVDTPPFLNSVNLHNNCVVWFS